jgi:hypothetical protein
MKHKLLWAVGCSVSILILCATVASASTTLNPGDTKIGNPGALSVGGGASLVTSTGVTPYSFTATGGTITGTYDVTVYSDPSNVYCSGCYDFVLTVTSAGGPSGSTVNLQHITDGSFDSSQVTVGINGSGNAPDSVSRTTSGKTVSFDFLGSDNITPGSAIPNLVIETSTMVWTAGSLVISDDVGSTFNGYGNLTSVPEPVSTALLGSGFAVLGLLRWRKARKV